MKIVSGFKNVNTPDWNKMIDNLKVSGDKFGIDVLRYDFPVQDVWFLKYPDIYTTMCWKYKIKFIKLMLKNYKEDIGWIDGDCLIRGPIDFESIMSDCDIALTLRDIKDREGTADLAMDGLIKTGVMFFKYTPATMNFLDKVDEKLLLSVFDQDAINKTLLMDNNLTQHGAIVSSEGALVKILNCRDYNFFYFDEDPKDAKILHFKGVLRKHYEKYLN